MAAIAKENDRLLDLRIAGKGDQTSIDARMKGQGQERGKLTETCQSATRQQYRISSQGD
jgi:hypothetical protein